MATATKTETDNAEGTATTSKKNKPSIMVLLPEDLRTQVIAKAESEDKANSRIVAEIVASYFGYALPEPERGRRTKDETGISTKNKNQAITMLLEMAKNGEVELNPDLKALLKLS